MLRQAAGDFGASGVECGLQTLRPGAAECVATLQKAEMKIVLISGDRQAAVADLATRLGIGDFHSSVDPRGKEAMVADLAAQGARVLMVGDGLNDTAALARAHASISPASALDAARVASDMVLTGVDLAPVAEAVSAAVTVLLEGRSSS